MEGKKVRGIGVYRPATETDVLAKVFQESFSEA